MKYFGVVVLLSAILGVKSQTPLQIDPEDSLFKHSHGNPTGEAKQFSGSPRVRLEQNVLPISYSLTITPVLEDGLPAPYEQFSAPGHVTILVNCTTRSTRVIQLHKHKILDVIDAETTFEGVTDPSEIFVVNSTLNEDQELLILTLDNDLIPGNLYQIYIKFVAPVDNTGRNNGLYKSQYITPDGDISLVATTQFEAASARQAFPCFDEPAIKAEFQLTLGFNNQSFKALTNTAPEGEPREHDELPNYVYQQYRKTVKMSSYLVAITIANFDYEEETFGALNRPARVYGPPHLMENQDGKRTGGVFAANASARLLEYFETRFEIDYKLSKMDSLAVLDFNFGAMENWGLNIYRQEYLLYLEGISTENNRKLISSVLSHELAHQWFGNLVTCEWWSHIYLHEGFASYLEYKGAQVVAPEFEFDKLSLIENLQVAMVTDASSATHPLINAADPDHANELLMVYFDRITYQKGSAIIYMMEGFLGEETLRRALINYLNGMEYQAARQDDLFRYLTAQAHLDEKISLDLSMKEIMDTWTLQSGFPVVRVSKAGSSRIYVSQERFTNAQVLSDESDLDPNELWYVPISIASADSPDFKNYTPVTWLEKHTLLKSVSVDTTKWLIVNPDATGYYRVLYDTPLTDLILSELNNNFENISERSRSQLIDDYFSLASQSYINLESALEFTKYVEAEPKFIVWRTLLTHMSRIMNKLSGTSAAFDPFKQYMLPRIEAQLARLGKEQIPEDKQIGWQVILRAQLLDWACALEQTECREYATRLFDEWNSTDSKSIPTDLIPVAYCGKISHGGIDAYEKVKEIYNEVKDIPNDDASARLRVALLNGMGCAQEAPSISDLLNAATNPGTFLLPRDKGVILQRLAANANARSALTAILRQELQILIIDLTSDVVASIVSTLSLYLSTDAEVEELRLELTDPKYNAMWGDNLNAVRGYFGTMAMNVAWRKEHDERLKDWFTANK